MIAAAADGLLGAVAAVHAGDVLQSPGGEGGGAGQTGQTGPGSSVGGEASDVAQSLHGGKADRGGGVGGGGRESLSRGVRRSRSRSRTRRVGGGKGGCGGGGARGQSRSQIQAVLASFEDELAVLDEQYGQLLEQVQEAEDEARERDDDGLPGPAVEELHRACDVTRDAIANKGKQVQQMRSLLRAMPQ